jgi:hypothetical protein
MEEDAEEILNPPCLPPHISVAPWFIRSGSGPSTSAFGDQGSRSQSGISADGSEVEMIHS